VKYMNEIELKIKIDDSELKKLEEKLKEIKKLLEEINQLEV